MQDSNNLYVNNKKHGYWEMFSYACGLWYKGTFVHGVIYGYWVHVYNKENTEFIYYAR
jgi:hypothetical protein